MCTIMLRAQTGQKSAQLMQPPHTCLCWYKRETKTVAEGETETSCKGHLALRAVLCVQATLFYGTHHLQLTSAEYAYQKEKETDAENNRPFVLCVKCVKCACAPPCGRRSSLLTHTFQSRTAPCHDSSEALTPSLSWSLLLKALLRRFEGALPKAFVGFKGI